ncbi:MAG: peptidoglycan DD-metalloendopeptidase family protein, partial [Candidatus Niameybacter stercoravium]|nr:peptidoglycan DD-metalloendopeptidase family protein [Candidatus Niameybacter stercoravium]
NNSYAISVDGEVVGVVKTKEEAQAAFENIVTALKDQKGVDIAIKETVAVEHVNSKAKEIGTQEVLESTLKDTISYEIEAYEILVDGEVKAVVETQEIAEHILSDIAKMHLPEGSGVELDVKKIEKTNETVEAEKVEGTESIEATKLEPATTEAAEENTLADENETSPIEVLEVKDALKEPEVKSEVKVGAVDKKEEEKEEPTEGQKIARELTEFDFNEEVIVRSTYIDEEQILGEEEAKNILLGNTEEIVEYELKEGDNIWDIAIKHGTTMDHILEINPQIEDETRMQIGEVIKLEVPDPILSISTTEQATFKELIPAEIEYVEFSDLYKDETKVYQEGYDGVKEITVDVHKVNGKEVSRDLITEKVLKEPKTKVIAFGTKEKPKPKPTSTSTNKKPSSSVSSSNSGMFMHPLNGGGTLTSNYGSRWGSFHRGLDIAAPAGTPIYAAAAGTVTYSGYNNGGFGKLIIIDHNNGYQTYYAHCSSLYAQVGQKVSKGQNIAGVGSTGNSTGNHVHFEIRSNGTPINPYNYVY